MKAKPLAGRRILVTRASAQAFGLAEPLRDLGAQVIEVPTIEIRSAGNIGALDNALIKIDHYDTLILTSVNGVERLFERYNRLGLPIVDMQHLMVVAIGPATARAIQSGGWACRSCPRSTWLSRSLKLCAEESSKAAASCWCGPR
jgi:uroporphyrinogen III methyltransferase/synthase